MLQMKSEDGCSSHVLFPGNKTIVEVKNSRDLQEFRVSLRGYDFQRR